MTYEVNLWVCEDFFEGGDHFHAQMTVLVPSLALLRGCTALVYGVEGVDVGLGQLGKGQRW